MAEDKTDKSSKGKEKVKELQAELKESASKIWLAGLGALQSAEEEGSKLFRSLVEKGEEYESKGRERVETVKDDLGKRVSGARDRASGTVGKIEEHLDEAVSGALKRFGVPTRDEIGTLTKRVEELTRVVESLKEQQPAKKSASTAAKASTRKAPAKKAAARKTAAKKAAASKTSTSKSSSSNG
ncbi:MAG: phasin family protein [Thermoanaerobaculia bacterium]|nr:phasin family protein [Thermoanaerobaculia bacterium]